MLCEALGHEDKPPILPAAEFANSVNSSRAASAAECGGDRQRWLCAA
jgi:hypothetical protein